VNYPLVPIETVDDLRPRDVAAHAIAALGATIPTGADPKTYFPVRGAAVTRVSYAIDLNVSDPLKIITGCAALARRNPATFTSWGMPPETIQWASKSLGSKFYAKGLELKHRAKNDDDKRRLGGLIACAERAVRFEVSFRGVRALRDLFGLSDTRLPNLAIVCDPHVARYALGREATRLRLYDAYSFCESHNYGAIVRHVVATLRNAQARLAKGELNGIGRRKTLTDARLWDLCAAFFLFSGFTPNALSSWTGRSRASLDELRSELRQLGIPPDRSISGGLGEAATEVAELLRQYVDFDFQNEKAWTTSTAAATAPWSSDVLASEVGITLDDANDEPAELGLSLPDDNQSAGEFDELLSSM